MAWIALSPYHRAGKVLQPMSLTTPASLILRFRDLKGDQAISLTSFPTVIGRSSSCDVYIQDDTISRNHARIYEKDGALWIEDLGSRNGVHVGNMKITSMPLREGMVLQLGSISVLVEGSTGSVFNIQIDHDLPSQGVLDSQVIDEFEKQLESQPVSDASGSTSISLGVALDLFKNAAETLLTRSNLVEVAQGAIDLALRSLPVDRGFLSLVEGDSLIPCASRSHEGIDSEGPMQLSSTIAKQVLDERRAVLIQDTGTMSNLAAAQSIIQMQIQSAMCAPLLQEGEVVGILYVDCVLSKKPLGKDHLDVICALALMASSALEQFRLRHAMEEEKRRRKDLSCRLSPNVVERVLAGKAELGSKETEISVLFADMVGFTTISENLTPREVVDLLNILFEELTDEVFKEDGTLDKYVGDALIAFFGAPEKQHDHAVRAVRSGLAMQSRIQQVAAMHPEWPPLSLRIGINSGQAVVGDIGSVQRSDYTVIGDTVNIASRLESQVAAAGEVVVGPDTARECLDLFELEQLPETPLKGKKKMVQPWRILSHKNQDSS
ncbi:MAG: FHA domain-containing protein [Planctomycetes bacterium]|nr:FHA domain-containing protein [Planctomycetota bacterium]